jgi:hypothetical protein
MTVHAALGPESATDLIAAYCVWHSCSRRDLLGYRLQSRRSG